LYDEMKSTLFLLSMMIALASLTLHPDESSANDNVIARGATIRLRFGAIMGRTYGVRYRWKVNGWGSDSRVRSNDDEVIEDMNEGNVIRNTSQTQTHKINSINGDYIELSDGWWVTTDDVAF
jgi:hypothetical protein